MLMVVVLMLVDGKKMNGGREERGGDLAPIDLDVKRII
jgi:hypothetical protein